MVDGETVGGLTPAKARALGIACIYQQPALFPDLTVAENIALRLKKTGAFHLVRQATQRSRATELLTRIGAGISPDTDPAYKGADSLRLLAHVAGLAAERGYKLGNLDATIIAQLPKMAPHIQAMRENIARVLDADVAQVNIKATTEEGLGFSGLGEGIAAHAVVLMIAKNIKNLI